MNYWYIGLFWLLTLPTLMAQQKERADRYYEDLGYAQYIQLMGGGDWTSYDLPTLIKLATSYRKVADFKNAERAYQAVIDKGGIDPIYYLYYAQALQSNGFYGRAGDQYRIALEKMQRATRGDAPLDDERPKEGFEACQQPHLFKAKGYVNLYNVEAINGPDLDFSPM